MNIDPSDEPKFNELIASLLYFHQKYGAEFGQVMMARMVAPYAERLSEATEEEKSYIYNAGIEGLGKAASVMRDQFFPFGHKGDNLQIDSEVSNAD